MMEIWIDIYSYSCTLVLQSCLASNSYRRGRRSPRHIQFFEWLARRRAFCRFRHRTCHHISNLLLLLCLASIQRGEGKKNSRRPPRRDTEKRAACRICVSSSKHQHPDQRGLLHSSNRRSSRGRIPVVEVGVVAGPSQELAAIIREARPSSPVIRVFDSIDIQKSFL